jgi:hypothetical protein
MVALLQIMVIPYALFFAFYIMGSDIRTFNWFSLLIFSNILGLASGFFFAQNANTKLAEFFRSVVSTGELPKFRTEPEGGGIPVSEGAE